MTYGDGVGRHRHRRADRVPRAPRQARDGDGGASARPLRRARARRRPGRRLRREAAGRQRLHQRRLLRAVARRCSTSSTATRRAWEREPLESLARDGAAGGLSATPASGSRWTRCATGSSSKGCGSRAARLGKCGATERRRHAAAALPAVRAGAGAQPGRSRLHAARQCAADGRRRRQRGRIAPIRCMRASARAACSCRWMTSCRRRRSFRRLRLFLLLFATSWVEHARRYAGTAIDAVRPRPQARWWSRSPATTATCCSISCRAACRCWASSRRPTSPQVAGDARRADRGGVLRPRTSRASSPRDGGRADLMAANNVLAHVPDIDDFVARLRARC